MKPICHCRHCGDLYYESNSRANIPGYCTTWCQDQMARKYGWHKPRQQQNHTQLDILSKMNKVGTVYCHLNQGK